MRRRAYNSSAVTAVVCPVMTQEHWHPAVDPGRCALELALVLLTGERCSFPGGGPFQI